MHPEDKPFIISTYIFNLFRGRIDKRENALLQEWISEDPSNKGFLDRLLDEATMPSRLGSLERYDREKIWKKVSVGIAAKPIVPEKRKRFASPIYWSAAASLFLILSLSAYFLFLKQSFFSDSATQKIEILPGRSVATLTLSDGETIQLSDHKQKINKGAMDIVNNGGGELIYRRTDNAGALSGKYNTISVPRAGEFRLELADGTKVWLNAESSLKFPERFGTGERRVSLTGEGYFEVSKDKEHPFIVSSAGQEVRVLGTRFNINSYPDEGSVLTTLAEGSVKVTTSREKRSTILIPGQRSSVRENHILIEKADLESDLAWKDNDFIFNKQPLYSILKDVSKWYDLEVVYEAGAPKNEKFTGYISRRKNFSAMLQVLERTGKVKLSVKDRVLTVQGR